MILSPKSLWFTPLCSTLPHLIPLNYSMISTVPGTVVIPKIPEKIKEATFWLLSFYKLGITNRFRKPIVFAH